MRRVGWCISILSIFKVYTPVLVCHQVPQKISFGGSACPPEALGRCGRVLGRGKISARYKGKNLRHQKTPPRNIGGVLACWLGVCLGGRGLFACVRRGLFASVGGVCFEPVKCLRFLIGWLERYRWVYPLRLLTFYYLP